MPDTITLTRRDGHPINLGRHPESPAARRFTAKALALVEPVWPNKRPLGKAGRATLLGHLGIVLAGLMRPGITGTPVRARRSPNADMWNLAPFAFTRFWTIIEALEAAGLLVIRPGVVTPGNTPGTVGGLATALLPSTSLRTLAASCGLRADTRKADWRADPSILATPKALSDEALVTVRPADGLPAPVLMPPMEEALARMRAEVREINAFNANAGIRGAGHTATLRRRFQHSIHFGGRFYAPVATMSPEDRLRITMGGRRVAEIDVKASQLTVLLGLWGGHSGAPKGDPYDVPGIPRDPVKAWTMQCLGSGGPFTQWSTGSEGKGSGFKASQIGKPMLERFPVLGAIGRLVPPSFLEAVPTEQHQKMAGQWVVQMEARIINDALLAMVGAGIPALPVHDALIVPEDAVDAAKGALEAAFMGHARIKPRLEVKRAG